MNTTVDLNVASYKLPVLVHYVQHSTEIPIDFVIHDYEIPSGATARFYLRKPSGNEVYNDCTISGNKITLQPSAQTFAEKGLQKAQLQLMIEDKFLISFPIDFDVAENIIDSSAIESSNEYGALESLLQEAQTNIPAAGEAATAANQAAQAANTAAGEANEAAEDANDAATAANKAAGAANTAASEANTAAGAANTAAGSANTAAAAANQAANQAMLKQVAYYNTNQQDILETAIDGSMLVAISASNNAELYEVLGSSAIWAWVYQFFFGTPSATAQRVQIAFSRSTTGAKSYVAYRTYESEGFTPWALVNNDLLLPASGALPISKGGTGGTTQSEASGSLGFPSIINGTSLAANTDLNTIIKVGSYKCTSPSTAATLGNCPTTQALKMYVENSVLFNGGDYRTQTIIDIDGTVYTRYTPDLGTNWSSWKYLDGMTDSEYQQLYTALGLSAD